MPHSPIPNSPCTCNPCNQSLAPLWRRSAIALGVMLVATPNSKIAIGAGVCIGMGAILQAHGGTIEIKNGATLGAGVLVVGKGTIGANACIGAAATIYNASIEPLQIVPAGSVIGDESRKVLVNGQAEKSKAPEAAWAPSSAIDDPEPEPEEKPASQEAQKEISAANSGVTSGSEPEETGLERGETPEPETPAPEESEESVGGSEPGEQQKNSATIYGQLYVSRMLGTLFPRGQSLNSSRKE